MNNLIVIPTYISKKEHIDLLETCLNSIRKTTEKGQPIVIVDDCSPGVDDGHDWAELLANKHSAKYIKNEENLGFSKSVNKGLKLALEQNQNAILVNQDIEFIETNWVDLMEAAGESVVGALLLYPNRIIQHAGIYFSQITRSFDHRFKGCVENQPEANRLFFCPVTGALQFISNECLHQVGLYDERFFLGYEDVDYCLRVIFSGRKCLYNSNVKAIHHESVIRGTVNIYEQNQSYFDFVKKYKDVAFDGVAPTMFERLVKEDE